MTFNVGIIFIIPNNLKGKDTRESVFRVTGRVKHWKSPLYLEINKAICFYSCGTGDSAVSPPQRPCLSLLSSKVSQGFIQLFICRLFMNIPF